MERVPFHGPGETAATPSAGRRNAGDSRAVRILALQRAAGNRAVGRAVEQGLMRQPGGLWGSVTAAADYANPRYYVPTWAELRLDALMDLIDIAQTHTGRALLTALARAPAGSPKVIISANEMVVEPAANPRNRNLPATTPQISDVKYTPTAFKTGKAPNFAENRAEYVKSKRYNPWVMPDRSDITLYHELVHALHTQRGTTREKTDLVGSGQVPVVDPVDEPYVGSAFDNYQRKGVSVEEYATVGLGEFAEDEFNENRYRQERRLLGEDAPHRGYYTDKDERGRRPGS